MSLIYGAIALFIARTVPISSLPDVDLVCTQLAETPELCRAAAVHVGNTTLAGLSLALALMLLLGRVRAIQPRQIPSSRILVAAAIATATGIVIWAALSRLQAGPSPSRIDAITSSALVISFGNLAWPFLLLLAERSESFRDRAVYFLLALVIATLSPFRAVVLAVMVFGGLMPLARFLFARSSSRELILKVGLAVIGIACITGGALVLQTAERLPTGETSEDTTSVAMKLGQRIAYPLYQAHVAEQLASVSSLPGPFDEVLSKFRVSGKESMNAALYDSVYGEGHVGQMTTLYYGEAAANTALNPIFWIFAAPMLLFGTWLLFQRSGLDIGILVGVAIWRGSMGGLVSIVPAFLIQVIAFLLFVHVSRLLAKDR